MMENHSQPARKPGQRPRQLSAVLRWLVEPASAVTEIGRQRRARLLSSLLLLLFVLALAGTVASYINEAALGGRGYLVTLTTALLTLLAYALSRSRYFDLASWLLLLAHAAAPFAAAVLAPDIPLANSLSWAILPIVLSGILLPLWGTIVLTTVITIVALLLPALTDFTFASVLQCLGVFLATAGMVALNTHFRDRLERERQAELQARYREVQIARASLEERVAERTQELQQRARYLEATAEVARDAASMLDIQELLAQIVNLISKKFDVYHSGIFLLNETQEWAVLRAASSEGGQRMVARGHRLRAGEQGVVGYVIGQGEHRIALDVGLDAVHFDNPDLPQTRSEIALPLRARGEIIGALDVQSTEPAAFSEEDVTALQTLADQVAVAISNAELFQRVEESLAAERRAYGEISRGAWIELLQLRKQLGYRYEEGQVTPLIRPAQHPAAIDETPGELPEMLLPVKARGQVIGRIRARKPAEAGEWTANERQLLETLTAQLDVALESARLYQDTQRRAATDRLVGEVTDHMRETLDVNTVLQTAVREIHQALGLGETEVWIGEEWLIK
ncbi:MAG: GAF domain-containing protein [Anaerolineae bacterium]|nr:GAF domain-containing protein [Anaerolineae bacterium]